MNAKPFAISRKRTRVENSKYAYAKTEEEFNAAIETIEFPCVVKPFDVFIRKGQSTVKSETDAFESLEYGTTKGRGVLLK